MTDEINMDETYEMIHESCFFLLDKLPFDYIGILVGIGVWCPQISRTRRCQLTFCLVNRAWNPFITELFVFVCFFTWLEWVCYKSGGQLINRIPIYLPNYIPEHSCDQLEDDVVCKTFDDNLSIQFEWPLSFYNQERDICSCRPQRMACTHFWCGFQQKCLGHVLVLMEWFENTRDR